MAEKLNAILNSYIADGTATKDKLLGAAFMVVNKDGTLYQHAAGRTRVSPTSAPFTPTSITWIASMTKLLTTVCVLHLLSHAPQTHPPKTKEPLLTLDTNLLPLIPELAALQILTGFSSPESAAAGEGGGGGAPLLVDNTAPLTLRHLLTHTAGLGIDVADPDLSRWSAWVGRTANVGSCTLEGWSTPLKFVPGKGGWYYGTGVDWAGVVLERVSGVRLGVYLGECLKGLEGTGFVLGRLFPGVGGEREKGERYVPVSERDGEGGLKEGVTGFPDEPVCESGGAGLYSNAVDFARVLKGLLGSLAGEEGILGREMAEEMFKPQLDEVQKQWLRGIVWNFGAAAEVPEGMAIDHGIGGLLAMEDVEGKRRKGSLWWSGMCNSRWWIDPETGIGGVLIVNVMPYKDATALKLWDELERAVYAELVPGQSSK